MPYTTLDCQSFFLQAILFGSILKEGEPEFVTSLESPSKNEGTTAGNTDLEDGTCGLRKVPAGL